MRPLYAVRFFIIFFALAFCYLNAYSQAYIGGKIGFQMSKLNHDDKDYKKAYDVNFSPGYNIGAAFNIKVTESFDLYTEILYSKKATQIKKDDVLVKDRLVFSYFDWPLLLRTNVYKSPNYNIFLQIGPTVGYWMKGKGIIESDELLEGGFPKLKYDFKWDEETLHLMHGVNVPEANKIQLSLNIGFGSEIKLRNKHIFLVDVRYEMGHTYLSKSDEKGNYLYGYTHDFKANNKTLMLSTAYLFNVQALRKKLMK